MKIYLGIWSFFALIVLGLAVYRRMLGNQEDDSLHVAEGTAGLISQQVANAQKIEVVEKWGKTLTAVLAVAGLIMAAVYFYGVWTNGSAVVE